MKGLLIVYQIIIHLLAFIGAVLLYCIWDSNCRKKALEVEDGKNLWQ